ncbi:cation efflux family protein [Staphylococcus gallinarum]|uniref:Cation efflux family protein n=1 Tax=Staphylococcus gallinarum TaxID=1293 RepID=A0A380FKY3_STAGA|nr:cation efflux family protein [Staphylococcus gallinarum]
MSHLENLKIAQRGAYLSLVVYIILSIAKYIVGYLYNSAAVRADSLNNMTDIIVFFSSYYWFEDFYKTS